MVSTRKARLCEEAVSRSLSMASTMVFRAVSTPMHISVPYTSLSILAGTPMTRMPRCAKMSAPCRLPSPPATITASIWASFRLRMASVWLRGSRNSGQREVWMMVPPRCKIPPTSRAPRGRNAPRIRPSKPFWMPRTRIFLANPLRTTARTKGFMPGASPPEVMTAMVFRSCSAFVTITAIRSIYWRVIFST